jgi:phage repressor protein C with HTH and peptisase S24 domain
MEMNDPRTALERLITERREDYAGLSRLIGRNAAYIQQFIKRGTPKSLAEKDRRILARYFQIDEEVLGGPAIEAPPEQSGLIPIPRFNVSASAGSGALDDEERAIAHIGFDSASLSRISRARPKDLSIIRVEGDSMFPTLSDGDDIMVDRSAGLRRVQDGIYVLRRDDTLIVKRLTVDPTNGLLTIASDNPAYATIMGSRPQDVDIIGRVVWAGRTIR